MYHMVRCSQGGTLNVLLHVDGHLSSGRVPIPSSVGPSVKHAESDGLGERLCSRAQALQLEITTQPICASSFARQHIGHMHCANQKIAGPPVKSVRHAGMHCNAISHRPMLLRPRSLVSSPSFSTQLRTPGIIVQRVRKPVVAAATQSGTVKMVVQGRQIELTPSIKQYAEEKVGAQTQI